MNTVAASEQSHADAVLLKPMVTQCSLCHAVLPMGLAGLKPCPELLTETEAISYLRLDLDGPENPSLTLRYYRERGLLRGTRVGRRLRYRRIELERFLERVTEARSNSLEP